MRCKELSEANWHNCFDVTTNWANAPRLILLGPAMDNQKRCTHVSQIQTQTQIAIAGGYHIQVNGKEVDRISRSSALDLVQAAEETDGHSRTARHGGVDPMRTCRWLATAMVGGKSMMVTRVKMREDREKRTEQPTPFSLCSKTPNTERVSYRGFKRSSTVPARLGKVVKQVSGLESVSLSPSFL